jgi:hypothetical protein
MPYRLLNILFLTSFIPSLYAKPVNYQYTAKLFIDAIRKGEDTRNFTEVFRYANHADLASQIATDDQKKTFWINIYNGYIQVILSENPEKYNDRSRFFKEKQINIGGTLVSFADIEHGVLRGSQHEYFLGYWKKWFPSAFEKKFRVSTLDYRIHFALNCGALSCPPVAVYDIERINEQLSRGTADYLKKHTTYDPEIRTAHTTSLFGWFRGDFGGLDGVKTILFDLGLIPDKDVRIKTSPYDWTLALNRFIDL